MSLDALANRVTTFSGAAIVTLDAVDVDGNGDGVGDELVEFVDDDDDDDDAVVEME